MNATGDGVKGYQVEMTLTVGEDGRIIGINPHLKWHKPTKPKQFKCSLDKLKEIHNIELLKVNRVGISKNSPLCFYVEYSIGDSVSVVEV